MRARRLSTTAASSFGRYPSKFLRLCKVQRCTTAASPNTLFDARGQRLGAVDDAEHARGDVEASGDQMANRAVTTVVLGVAQPEPDGDLGAGGLDRVRRTGWLC